MRATVPVMCRIAFPNISCGAFGYPHAEAADVSLQSLADGLERHAVIESARMVLFSDELFELFRASLRTLREG